MSLPAKIHNWFAFIELQDALNGYIEIFPLLHKLASKVQSLIKMHLLVGLYFRLTNYLSVLV